MKENCNIFYCIILIIFLAMSFSGCNNPVVGPENNGPPVIPLKEFDFNLDRTHFTKFVLTGDEWVKPDNPTVTVTNTGRSPISISTRITGINNDCFSVIPSSVENLPSGASFTFLIQIEIYDPGGYTFEATVWFETSIDEGNLFESISLRYGGIVLEEAEIIIDKWPLQNNVTARLSSDDEEYTQSTPWFVNDEFLARIDGNNIITSGKAR